MRESGNVCLLIEFSDALNNQVSTTNDTEVSDIKGFHLVLNNQRLVMTLLTTFLKGKTLVVQRWQPQWNRFFKPFWLFRDGLEMWIEMLSWKLWKQILSKQRNSYSKSSIWKLFRIFKPLRIFWAVNPNRFEKYFTSAPRHWKRQNIIMILKMFIFPKLW